MDAIRGKNPPTHMKIHSQIKTLEESGLVRLAQPKPDLEYLFRHALVQETAYASILKAEQRHLHQLVGETLENLYPDRLEELAPVLGRHYDEAGVYPTALKYLKLAGDLAASQYALQEAVEHYSLAIEAAKKSGVSMGDLFRLRGGVYETIGDFDRARADRESCLLIARAEKSVSDEWLALLDLGLLWAGRDYQQTGEYYRQAYDLAQANGNPVMLAHALNRLANWHLNLDETEQARQLHLQALEIFENIPDQAGTAETLDLLGMASFLSGNLIDGRDYLKRAIMLFRQMGNVRLLMSSLASLSMCTAINQTESLIFAEESDNSIHSAEESLKIAQATGNRAGEAFGYFALAQIRNFRAEYGPAFEAVQASIKIAEEIQHRQWTCAGYFSLGCWYYNLLSYPSARQSFDKALALGRELGSTHWQMSAGAMIIRTLVASGSLNEADKLLDDLGVDEILPVSLGVRMIQLSRVELALARKDPSSAGQILDRLSGMTPHLAEYGEPAAIGLCYLRARALTALQRYSEAVALLNAVLVHVIRVGAGSMEWRVRALLAVCYRNLSQIAFAEEQARLTEQIIRKFSTAVPLDEVKQHFIEFAQNELDRAT